MIIRPIRWFWRNYTNIMDELYKAVDLQRNLGFKSWHDHDKDALKDYLDLDGVGEPAMKFMSK